MYVAYHKETTRYLTNHPGVKTDRKVWETAAAARAAITREAKAGRINREDFDVAESFVFHKEIEKQVTRTNLMSGKPFQQPANTPIACDPSRETYWSI